MAGAGTPSPVVVDGIVSDEKLAELLALQTEYPNLDYKDAVDLTATRGKVEIAKDVGAMSIEGGYIIIGVDGSGKPTGSLDTADLALFDEARLVPMLRKWLPDTLEIHSRTTVRAGHSVAVICVMPHRAGCVFFIADGQHQQVTKNNPARHDPVVVFRKGDVYWRDGTRSERLVQAGLEEVVRRRVAIEKSAWITEQREIRLREREELERSFEGRRLSEGPLGSVNFDLTIDELVSAALEALRGGDSMTLQHLIKDGLNRARDFIQQDEFEVELGDLLDKLACLAANFLEYEQTEWFDRVIATLSQIYSLPLRPGDAERFGYSTQIAPAEKAPRVWLAVITRLFALGALAVRRRDWRAVRELTLQRPDGLTDYEVTWLRHALTMGGRGGHLERVEDSGRRVPISLLSLARSDIARLSCLRPEGLAPEADEPLTSLAQFDVLSNLVAIDSLGAPEWRAFYTNFARLNQDRVDPIVERLLTDTDMRDVLFHGDDEHLAIALAAIGQLARQEGVRFDGFWGWERGPIAEFIASHLPRPPQGA